MTNVTTSPAVRRLNFGFGALDGQTDTDKYFADGSMVHQFRTERSGNTTDGWGNVTGSFASSNASGDKYCWKLASGLLLYSSDGASYANFVNKVENNGYGVIFFQTRLGELKACQ